MHTGADRETNSWDGSRIVVQFSDIEGFPSCLIQPASSNLLEAMHINAQPAPEQWISADLERIINDIDISTSSDTDEVVNEMSKAIAEIAEQAQFEEKGFFTLNLGGAVEQLYETFGSPGNLTFPSLTRWTA
mmetsp:Transcript_33517/g.75247  ORF Transcript_33517/g.75247 Transcript_33517/m.75247 type:complete len:132 (-) Transcript_33517:2022-2417(-)